MREINRERKKHDLAFMLLADHALYHIEADLHWIDLTESRLINLQKELALWVSSKPKILKKPSAKKL